MASTTSGSEEGGAMNTSNDQARAAVDKLEAAVHVFHDQDGVRLSHDDMQAIFTLRNWARERLTLSVPTVSTERPSPSQVTEARTCFDYLFFDKESVRELERKIDSILGKDATKRIRTLITFSAPPTDDEILSVYELQRGTWERAAIQTVRFFFGPVKS